jgi:ribosomal protein S18 acetylase RimI-like enzyme
VVTVREATAGDGPFLLRMVAVAADWRPGTPVRPTADVLADPRLAHYAVGWPRDGDRGVVAEDGGAAVGAAWWRSLPATDPGYGFVDAAVPEVSIGVLPGHRGAGVGTALLDALIGAARAEGLPALSLSVEVDNPAVRLYVAAGFRRLVEADGAATMLLRLDRET